ncbi:hypothetical protein ACLB2K_033598 [Fragaria x ananassa]
MESQDNNNNQEANEGSSNINNQELEHPLYVPPLRHFEARDSQPVRRSDASLPSSTAMYPLIAPSLLPPPPSTCSGPTPGR